QVAHPLGLTTRRDQVAAVPMGKHVHRGGPPLPARPATYIEHAAAPHAEASPGEPGHGRVEQPTAQPPFFRGGHYRPRGWIGLGVCRHWVSFAIVSSALYIEQCAPIATPESRAVLSLLGRRSKRHDAWTACNENGFHIRSHSGKWAGPAGRRIRAAAGRQ